MAETDGGGPGLAWPDHDTGPMPPPEYQALDEPPQDERRKPMAFWDRAKILVVIVAVWALLFWELKSDNPIITWADAARETWSSKWWLVALGAVELVRQLHFLLSERWSRYHRFWAYGVFGRFERRVGRLDDWNRYRLARAFKLAAFLAIVAVVLGALYDESPPAALFGLPSRLWDAAPWILQLAFGFLFVAVQFLGIFWLLSRGGTEVYFPDDIKTRFTDVWGQDAVLERVKENILFLEKPEAVEEKGGYVPGGILLWGPPGTGKGQPVSAVVMTPDGPRRMGDLLPGDEVIGANGRPTTVLEVHLLGERDLFRVRFSDGASLLVTEDHLWAVESRYGGGRVLETSALVGRTVEADGHYRYRIPMTAPVEFNQRELPLHPYVLGALLGDGTFRHQVGISSGDLELLARFELLLPDGDGVVRRSTYDWAVIGGATRTALKELDLFGLYSAEKFVPPDYLWTTAADRLELLRGLMDTDGNIDKRGVVEYHTTSPRLADDVRFLVESLGGTCSLTTRTTRYRHKGVALRGKPVTIVRIALPPGVMPVTLPRKVERFRPRTKYLPQRRIIAVEREGREEARCIRVAADDHLYVTERFIVTHNTLMAEAVAGETGKPYMFVDPGAFINMFFGVGILKVKSLFRKLRKLALRYGGVIVFFDEADSLGNRGAMTAGPFGGAAGASPFTHAMSCNGLSYLDQQTVSQLLTGPHRDGIVMGAGMGGGGMGTLQALLTELSGLKKPRGFLNRVVRRTLGMRPKPPPKYRILVMMATNMPQALDEALLRPGRIDRIYKVGYPSKAGRVRTYEGYLAKVRHTLTEHEIDKLATITPYATGATIKDLVNESLICAIRDGREAIEWRDVVRAKQLKDLGPPEDVEYIERERHAVAVHEACHAVAAYRVRQHLTIDIATIEKGGTYLGMVASIPPEDQFTRWRTEYEADIVVSLSSLAGERMFFEGDNSSGVSGDLESATQIATLMEGYWGMGSTITSHGVTQRVGIAGGGKPGEVGGKRSSKEKDLLEGSLGRRIEAKLEELLDRTEALLADNRAAILAVAHALETHKTVTGEDIEAIIEGREGPLIDGRPYHDPNFVAAAEEYHSTVVGAHQRHAKVDVSLPEVPPWDGSGQYAAARPRSRGRKGAE